VQFQQKEERDVEVVKQENIREVINQEPEEDIIKFK